MPARVSPPPAADLSNGLTPEQLDFWNTNGYLLIPDALSADTTKSLLEEAHTMLDNFSLDDHPMTKFSTGEKSDHVGDSYFLDSGDKVRFFFEEGMTSPLPLLLSALLIEAQQTPSTQTATSQSQNQKPSTRSATTCTVSLLYTATPLSPPPTPQSQNH
jgi:hypothetical protein